MTRFKTLALVCASFFMAANSNAQNVGVSTITVNGSQNNIHFETCAAIQPIDFNFYSTATFEANVGSAQSFKYEINFYRNGSQIATHTYNSGDPEIECYIPPICPNIPYTFEDVAPLSGYYYAKIIIRRYILGFYAETVHTEVTNTITVSRPDDGTYATCVGADHLNFISPCTNNNEIYQFVNGEYFMVQKNTGMVYKFANLGSSGDNVWGLTFNPPANAPGYSNLIGYHDFVTPITDMLYTNDGKTIISFSDGKVLKINGTGGSGSVMFAVTETPTSFANISPYTYYAGDHKFLSGVTDLFYKDNKLFISCLNGNMLKVNGSGGTGSTMFAVTETPSGFTNISGYSYYSGDFHFQTTPTQVYSVGNFMFIGTVDGKLLKINNTGGSGNNMFAVFETSSGYININPYTYYSGSQKFLSAVSSMYSNGTFLFIGLSNGKILKINGAGGSGSNMFAISETPTGFNGLPSYSYYVGDIMFSSPVRKMTHNGAGNRLFLAFANGKVLKIINSGSTGHNMFNATEVANGFVTTSSAYSTQVEGSTNFNATVTDLEFFGSTQIICLANNKILKINGNGGTGLNMYAVSQNAGGFRPLLGYTQYLTGSQFLGCPIVKKDLDINTPNEEEISLGRSNLQNINVYPNPFADEVSIDLPLELQNSTVVIEVVDLNGSILIKSTGDMASKINTQQLSSGFYLVTVKHNDVILQTTKIIKK